MHNPGASRRGNADASLHVIARSTCDEAIQTFFAARWIASQALAMTTSGSTPTRHRTRAGFGSLKSRDALRIFRWRKTPMTLHADFASQDYFRNPAAAIEKLRAAGPV